MGGFSDWIGFGSSDDKHRISSSNGQTKIRTADGEVSCSML